MSEMNPVKPFPHVFCEGCMLNGCYPWNKIIILCCSEFGGIMPVLLEEDLNFKEITRCLNYELVTEDTWQNHLKGLKKESLWNEKMRKKAWDGEVHTNQTLPEHIFLKTKKVE